MQKMWARTRGFTIVELIVVIVIIGILVAISNAVYAGIQTRSKLGKIETDIKAVQKLIESYKARNGTYPVTAAVLNPNWATETAWTDNNCPVGAKRADWVPDVGNLPQSQLTKSGVADQAGCYVYTSDGMIYILSAWNMLPDPQTSKFYRRVGFREMNAPTPSNQLFYLCNYANINGTISGSYNAYNDYYKHSYTVSNITSSTCNETPQAGA